MEVCNGRLLKLEYCKVKKGDLWFEAILMFLGFGPVSDISI